METGINIALRIRQDNPSVTNDWDVINFVTDLKLWIIERRKPSFRITIESVTTDRQEDKTNAS